MLGIRDGTTNTLGMQIHVNVESWFAGGVVVSFTDEYGVEYRGALLKRTEK